AGGRWRLFCSRRSPAIILQKETDVMAWLVPHPTLLAYAQRLFGPEIVTHAWLVMEVYFPAEMVTDFTRTLAHNPEELRYDDREIVLECVNGRRVLFSASEWAALRNG